MRRYLALLLCVAACSESTPADANLQTLLSVPDAVDTPARSSRFMAAIDALARRQGLAGESRFACEDAQPDVVRTRAARIGTLVVALVMHPGRLSGRLAAAKLLLIDSRGTIVDRLAVNVDSRAASLAVELRDPITITIDGSPAWAMTTFAGQSRLHKAPPRDFLRASCTPTGFRVPSLDAAAPLEGPFLPIEALPTDPAAGPYASRFARRVGRDEESLRRALAWLARQWPDHESWGVATPGHGLGVNGLVLLAFLGAGFTPVSTEEWHGIRSGRILSEGLAWLLERQDVDGCISDRSFPSFLDSHFVATMALVEAWGVTRLERYREPARLALAFLLAAQNPGRGFRDSVRPGDSDTHSTGWAYIALRAAQKAGLEVPGAAYDGMRAWIDDATDASGRTGYKVRGEPDVDTRYEIHETMTAIAHLVRGKALAPAPSLPAWGERSSDGIYWFFTSMATVDRAWHERLTAALREGQEKDGSWPCLDRWGGGSGLVYATALNALTLQVGWRWK